VKDSFGMPTIVYQVSGEYSIAVRGHRARLAATRIASFLESLTSFKRAGADGIITYFARDVARRLKSG